MDDLAGMLSQFLSSEEGMNQVRAVASALGLDDSPVGQQAPPQQPIPQQQGGIQGLDAGTLLLLQQAATTFSQSDPNTELLRALKPHFSPERARRVDDAVRILQLLRLLPLLRDSGLLPGTKEERR